MQRLWQELGFVEPVPMKQPLFVLIAVLTLALGTGFAQLKTGTTPLDDLKLQPSNVKTEWVTYKGRKALRVTDIAPASVGGIDRPIILNKTEFQDGVIEIELTGEPGPNAGEGARGFVGVAFRVMSDAEKDAANVAAKYECFYLRPTNGRADDQVRRNHSTQYSSYPDFDFARSRAEAPEKYESYVDLEPGAWTKFKIVVDGRKARLYVHGAEQPCLIVDDLKLEPRDGGVALWVGPGTEGYFANLKVTPKK